MKPDEYKYVVFDTEAQWKSGILSRLKFTDTDGLTLHSRPVFESWLVPEAARIAPTCLGVDRCGLVYWIDAKRCQLYSFNQKSGLREHVPCFDGCGGAPGEVDQPDRMTVDQQNLLLLDRGNRRVLVYATELFQLVHIISIETPGLRDIGYDGSKYLYLLDNQAKWVVRFDKSGSAIGDPIDLVIDGSTKLNDPFRLLVGDQDSLYVLDRDADAYRLYMHIPDEKRFELISDFSDNAISQHPFRPSIIIISKSGSILAAEKGRSVMHEFEPLGGYLGRIEMPGASAAITCMAFDVDDNLYVGTDRGIAKFSLTQSFVGEEGVYYSRTLDKGAEQRPWHRLQLTFPGPGLPKNTTIEISYYSSDNPALQNLVDALIDDRGRSVRRRIADLEGLLGPYWETEKNVVSGMLVRKSAAGRFLWLRLKLATFDPAQKPSLKSMKVYFPMLSYLRYLPAVYQEDPISRDFLERFLSLFETIFYDLESDILGLFKYFNPETTTKEFLPWLAGWLNMSFEEAWKEQTRRELIQNAVRLYKKKGTLAGIADFIEIVIGRRPIIYEDADFAEPFVLGGRFYVGENIVVTENPAKKVKPSGNVVPVKSPSQDVPGNTEGSTPSTYRFTVLLNLSREQFRSHRPSINRILEEEKPAHTDYTIRLIADAALGHLTFIGINTRLTGLKPFCVGISSIPGKTVLNIKGEKSGRLERNSRIGSTFTLT